MAVEVSRKLCLTAALLRVDSRKELAAAFRSVNPNSTFDVERAHKWVQGRSKPRDNQIYADWAKLVGLDDAAEWLVDCTAEDFLERLCAQHGCDPVRLRRRADTFGGAGVQSYLSRDRDLVGTFACYSPAWSAYHRGHLVRGTMTIEPASGPAKLQASYVEHLPTGTLLLNGPVVRGDRVVSVQLGTHHSSAQLFIWLFAPAPPTAVLGGLVNGTTLMSAEIQLSNCRFLVIRLPSDASPEAPPAYLPKDASIAADLARSGLQIDAPEAVDRAIEAFLSGGTGNFDQITATAYRSVVDLLAPRWLKSMPSGQDGPARLAVPDA